MSYSKLDELLTITMEEASEVIQECSKCIRFGYDEANITKLQKEVADMLFMLSCVVQTFEMDEEEMERLCEEKFKKLQTFSSLFYDPEEDEADNENKAPSTFKVIVGGKTDEDPIH